MVIVKSEQKVVLGVSARHKERTVEVSSERPAENPRASPSEGLGALTAAQRAVLKCAGLCFGVSPHQLHRHSPVALNIREHCLH